MYSRENVLFSEFTLWHFSHHQRIVIIDLHLHESFFVLE